jgi:DeoR/GlpR family transcriptional regulator of sugar metabolism
MLAAERKQMILGSLGRDGKVIAAELAARFEVSEDTIRRDLRELADDGLLHRVYGGALPKPPVSTAYANRRSESLPAKLAIGTVAAGLLEEGQTIIIDGGTTPLEVATHLPREFRATIITHSVPVMNAVAEHPNIELIIIGGTLYKNALAAVGAATAEAYSNIHADVCIVGMAGVHPDAGLTDLFLEETHVKRAMVAGAGKVMAVVSSEKLGTAATYAFAPLSRLTHLVTDGRATDELLGPYRGAGIAVLKS